VSQNHHQQAPSNELQVFLDARLRRQQQEESEKDSRWLHQQEENIKKRLSIASLNDIQIEQNTNGGTNHVVTGKPPVADKVPLSPRVPNEPMPSSSSPLLIEKKIDLKIDRANDPIYKCTTNVVRAVMTLSSGVEKSQINEYLELVKSVGLELRELLGTVDRVCNFFPSQTHK
jgi:focal adhesion kinase 1